MSIDIHVTLDLFGTTSATSVVVYQDARGSNDCSIRQQHFVSPPWDLTAIIISSAEPDSHSRKTQSFVSISPRNPPNHYAKMEDSRVEKTAPSFSNDPSITGYHPDSITRSWFNVLLGRMSEEGKAAYREDAMKRNEKRDIARVEGWRDYLFEYSPIIRFLNTNIQQLNGDLNPTNVRCVRCVTRIDEEGNRHLQGGGFDPTYGIQICANQIRSQGHLEDTLAHEMVHAYDHMRFKVDWFGDLRHAACTEVNCHPGGLLK